jgi:hypothetical protein
MLVISCSFSLLQSYPINASTTHIACVSYLHVAVSGLSCALAAALVDLEWDPFRPRRWPGSNSRPTAVPSSCTSPSWAAQMLQPGGLRLWFGAPLGCVVRLHVDARQHSLNFHFFPSLASLTSTSPAVRGGISQQRRLGTRPRGNQTSPGGKTPPKCPMPPNG